jgi:hypothetical protein
MTDDYLKEQDAVLEDDSRTMHLMNTEGYRVLINPHYGKNKEKLEKRPLFMGIQFLNDINKMWGKQTAPHLKKRTEQMNNV